MATYTMFSRRFSCAIGLSFTETAANTYNSMMGRSLLHAAAEPSARPLSNRRAAAGILLGKYLVFPKGFEKQMAGMNAEQVHNFKGADAGKHSGTYKYMIMVLVVVMVLFLLTRFPTCKESRKPRVINVLGAGYATLSR